MIRWTGLAHWEFGFTFPGSLISTFLDKGIIHEDHGRLRKVHFARAINFREVDYVHF